MDVTPWHSIQAALHQFLYIKLEAFLLTNKNLTDKKLIDGYLTIFSLGTVLPPSRGVEAYG